jgi:glycerophosphoryl diester phosphodiesterase
MVPIDRPVVVGHRGFPGRIVENTLPSFEAALAAGARGVECDVRPTRDGHPVVLHDATLERLLGSRERVDAVPRDRLRTMPYLTEPGLRVPDLDDVLVLAEQRDAFVLVELKGESLDLTRAVVAAVERTRTANRVAFLSFSPAMARAMRRLEPEIPCAPIFESAPRALDEDWNWIVVDAKTLTPGFARLAARRGVKVACYGVDDAATDARLDALGVGLRITDRPDLLAERRRS